MATSCSSIQAHIPPVEETHIPPVTETPTIDAVIPQHFPPFNRENLKLWFLQVEAAMRLNRLTSDSSRFNYIIPCIPSDLCTTSIMNIIETPPDSNKYDTLKSKLLELFGKSEETKIHQLLRICRMSDEKPSHFLQRMRSMVEKNMPDSVLKIIFLEQIPQSVCNALAVRPDADLTTLALLADRVMEFRSSRITSMSRSNMATSAWQSRAEDCYQEDNLVISHQPRENNVITHQLAEITRRMAAIETNMSRCRSFQRQSRSRGRQPQSRQRSTSTGRRGLCYYHFKFGARAYQCRTPCMWSSITVS
ncbi:hypothetical protein WN51_13918 [Melipona quadrifasciata]|uniref:DUF7041 domain-containing protein n=1 Tax=Melipona quadrifasciata TaxID=166423 RepID=A0A0M8ZYR5_9HYME|nr:hypothetical protein WN51_13918 [Melipona quadrifasciata]